jgi:hypothetical protein
MSNIDKVTGQRVDYKDHNDNSPPTYSAPSTKFKSVLRFHANLNCSRCGGTGYIGHFKNISGGRCFHCLPDERWNYLLGEIRDTGYDDKTGEPVCQIRFVSWEKYSSTGYLVTEIGLPPIGKVLLFSTIEEARSHASVVYGISEAMISRPLAVPGTPCR